MKLLLVLFVSAIGILSASRDAGAIDAQVTLGAPPQFFTDRVAGTIPFPASAPAAMQNHVRVSVGPKCGAPPSNGRISGLILFTDIHEKGKAGIPPGNAAIQIVTVSGTRWKFNPENKTCDVAEPFNFEVIEYFDNVAGAPSRDHHITIECLISRYEAKVAVKTAILPLPAAVRPFPGWGAGYPYTNAAEKAAIRAQVNANTTANWGYHYSYDGCHTPPKTPTATKHYLRYKLSYPGGPSGAVTQTAN